MGEFGVNGLSRVGSEGWLWMGGVKGNRDLRLITLPQKNLISYLTKKYPGPPGLVLGSPGPVFEYFGAKFMWSNFVGSLGQF